MAGARCSALPGFLLLALTVCSLVRCQNDVYVPKDCAEVRPWMDGVYVIRPEGRQPFSVVCRFDVDGTIWTLVQNNVGGLDWQREWTQYRNGFGWLDADRSFWLGLEKMHWLTARDERHYVLRIDIVDGDGNVLFADYDRFTVSDEANGYFVSYGRYLGGSAGDGLRGYNRNKVFSTAERDQDGAPTRNCAELHHGGWWYEDCGFSSLNRGDIYWNETMGHTSSTMRLRAK